MDLPRFVSFLATRRLWFSRADLLGDPWEGSLPKPMIEVLRAVPVAETPRQVSAKALNGLTNFLKEMPSSTYLNCWHVGEHESAAMWSVYGQAGKGVAIQTTIGQLVESIKKAPDTIYAGRVRYVNYETAQFNLDNMLWPYVHKRESFSYEQEFRLLQWRHAEPGKPAGIGVPVDMRALLRRVLLSPRTASWELEAVQALLDRFDVGTTARQSALDAAPLW